MVNDRCRRIQDLVVRIQEAFLDVPGLRLTVPHAQRRFDASPAECLAVLHMLSEAGVLTRSPHGHYARFYPRSSRHAAA